jgi:mannose-6-phosphate isomerase-like protein (cupin superfamily)
VLGHLDDPFATPHARSLGRHDATLGTRHRQENPELLGLAATALAGIVAAMSTTSMHSITTSQPSSPIVRHAAEGEHAWQARACVSIKLRAAESDGRVSAAEFLMPPSFGPPLHIHHGEDELLQVLEGAIRVVCGDEDVVVREGAFAFLPRGVPHTFWVEASGPARMLAVFTPGGIEAMFADAGVPADAACLPPAGTVPPAALAEEDYRIEIVGPPLGS